MDTMLQPSDWESLRLRLESARDHYEASRQRFVARQEAGASVARLRVRDTVMDRLQARLETLPTIEQAKGIIMARSGVGSEEAFDILRRASQRTNVKLRDLAADIVTRAERPAGPSRPVLPAVRQSGASA
jgi:AmiR/NasT family two-component response regulator